MPPRYNIAPTQPVGVVRMERQKRQFMLMRWGFIPSWVKDEKSFPLVINVRSETVREKPSFRNALRRRRCLMPVDGFYEWHRVGTGKMAESRPYLFRRPDLQPFAFAAIWECWSAVDGSEIDTVALLNGSANGLMSAVHERCPIILDPKDWPRWLDPDADDKAINAFMKPPPDDLLEMVRISTLVNKVGNDGPQVQVAWSSNHQSAYDLPSDDEVGVTKAERRNVSTKKTSTKAGARKSSGNDVDKQGSLF